MGLPGPIRDDGVVGSSAILPGWVGVSAVAEMRRRLHITILVDSDANLGAQADAAFGAARDASEIIYLECPPAAAGAGPQRPAVRMTCRGPRTM